MEPIGVAVDVRELVIDGVLRRVMVPVGTRTYGATESPDWHRPLWILVDIRQRTILRLGTIHPGPGDAAYAAWMREHPEHAYPKPCGPRSAALGPAGGFVPRVRTVTPP